MKKYFVPICMLLTACFTFTSCENKVEEKLEGDWKLVSMETTGFIISGQQLENPVLSLAKDKKYSIFIDGKLTKGKWKVKDNSFYLMAEDNKEETALIIDSLTDETLIYHNKAGKSDVKVYYTKVENEEEEEEGGEKK